MKTFTNNHEIALEVAHLAQGDTSVFYIYIDPKFDLENAKQIPPERMFGPFENNLHRKRLPSVVMDCYYRMERAKFCIRALSVFCGIESQFSVQNEGRCNHTGLPLLLAYHNLSDENQSKLKQSEFYRECLTTLGVDYDQDPTIWQFLNLWDYIPSKRARS